ncbi:growth hormone releasing hormone receptor 2 [Epinephelus moara]|uniref:growth hormone releasing hormone receptor 2 n=1 Tax=Epinephelus moara TaxID=300413 RepID=UPI00214F2B83|nr:growth hormone releasing hormone receptor 2 [Epinephelus moara]
MPMENNDAAFWFRCRRLAASGSRSPGSHGFSSQCSGRPERGAVERRGAVSSTHPECSIVLHLQEKEDECKLQMRTDAAASLQSASNTTAGCMTEWDGVSCWPAASEGQMVSVHCPLLLLKPETPPVLITRSCTVSGWSEPSVPYYKACYYEASEEDEDVGKEKHYFDTVRLIYSVGYGASLAALLVAVLLFCCFRKLLCTRNYIHLNLFVTFMLRSLAVFIKDVVLFADRSTDHCTVSTLWCKAAVTFFHFCVVSNFWWLLVEALYLQTLLLCTFTHTTKLFWIYATVGWGAPSVTVVIWALLKSQLDDEGCWDDLESRLWWIIKTPILLSIFINLVIFLNISRIIVQKTKATHVNQSETHLYRTLLRSTLLLIPLFGVHYVVFALIPEHVGVGPRLYFELVLGSFQGFIVALLYCFLNGEVHKEIQRTMRRCWPERKTNTINLPTQEFVP